MELRKINSVYKTASLFDGFLTVKLSYTTNVDISLASMESSMEFFYFGHHEDGNRVSSDHFPNR